MTTGERIRSAREEAGLSQEKLGARIGVSFQCISKWETDYRNPKYETLVRIADALGVSVSKLIGGNMFSPKRGEWVLETHSFKNDTFYESCELSVYITARCKECGCKHPNHYNVFGRTLYAPEDAEVGFRFDKKAEEEKLLAEFKQRQRKYNQVEFANFCPNCGADMRRGEDG